MTTPTPEELVELADKLSGPLFKLLLSATSVDIELRNEVDDRFTELRDALRRASQENSRG